jgi:REP element-mobilizing transposase RayT
VGKRSHRARGGIERIIIIYVSGGFSTPSGKSNLLSDRRVLRPAAGRDMAKRIRIKTDSKFHFVTFSVYKHIPVFRSDFIASEFYSNLKFYESKRQFNLLGYVIMPHHVHLLIELNNEGDISGLIRDIKKFFTYKFRNRLIGKTKFDISLFDNNGRFQFWERGFDEVTIISENVFCKKLGYIHNNPVKAGLVHKAADYPYSSAKEYLGGGSEDPPITGGRVE